MASHNKRYNVKFSLHQTHSHVFNAMAMVFGCQNIVFIYDDSFSQKNDAMAPSYGCWALLHVQKKKIKREILYRT